MAAPTIVFDLDGTLIDTAPDLVATLNTILAREGLPPLAFAAARNMVGGGARHMIERGLAAAPPPSPPPSGGGVGRGAGEGARVGGAITHPSDTPFAGALA